MKERRFRILECYRMLRFVARLRKVEVVNDCVFFSRDILKYNLKFKFAPTILSDAERRLLKSCSHFKE